MERNVPIWGHKTRVGGQFGLEGIKSLLTFLGPLILDLLPREVSQGYGRRGIIGHDIPVPPKMTKSTLNAFDRSWGFKVEDYLYLIGVRFLAGFGHHIAQ
jgi:hypothetical protein